MGLRKIVHIDMDAFYASVEQRDDPQLRGKPVIVAWRAKRSVVCAASYEARRFGVHSAMPAVRAERLCPDAIFVPPDFSRYRAVSLLTREIFNRHTDLVQPLSLDEAYLDVTENKTGLPTATRLASVIREQVRQELNLTASAGVAPNKFLAKVASDWRKPDGLFVIQPEDVDTFLLPLPVARLPGVGKVTEEKLERLGIKTVSNLRGLNLRKRRPLNQLPFPHFAHVQIEEHPARHIFHGGMDRAAGGGGSFCGKPSRLFEFPAGVIMVGQGHRTRRRDCKPRAVHS